MNRITAFFDRLLKKVANNPNLAEERQGYEKAKETYEELIDYTKKDVDLSEETYAETPGVNRLATPRPNFNRFLLDIPTTPDWTTRHHVHATAPLTTQGIVNELEKVYRQLYGPFVTVALLDEGGFRVQIDRKFQGPMLRTFTEDEALAFVRRYRKGTHDSGGAVDILTPASVRYSTRWYVDRLLKHYTKLYPNSIVGVSPMIESKFTIGYKVYINAPNGTDKGNVMNVEISNSQALVIVEWDENPEKPFDVRSEKEDWLKEDPDTQFVDIGPECFTDQDAEVISYKGNNYYAACEEFVREDPNDPDEDWTCVKRAGHPSSVHEDWEGHTAVDTVPDPTAEEERELRDRRTLGWLVSRYKQHCPGQKVMVIDDDGQYIVRVNGTPTYRHPKPEAWKMMEDNLGFTETTDQRLYNAVQEHYSMRAPGTTVRVLRVNGGFEVRYDDQKLTWLSQAGARNVVGWDADPSEEGDTSTDRETVPEEDPEVVNRKIAGYYQAKYPGQWLSVQPMLLRDGVNIVVNGTTRTSLERSEVNDLVRWLDEQERDVAVTSDDTSTDDTPEPANSEEIRLICIALESILSKELGYEVYAEYEESTAWFKLWRGQVQVAKYSPDQARALVNRAMKPSTPEPAREPEPTVSRTYSASGRLTPLTEDEAAQVRQIVAEEILRDIQERNKRAFDREIEYSNEMIRRRRVN